MADAILNISYDCHLEAHINGEYSCVFLEYVEHSPDGWFGDCRTCVDIDEAKAQAIADFLCKHLGVVANV